MTAYLKKVVEKFKEAGKTEEEIKAFQTKVQGYFTKEIAPNFKDFDFYTGESMDPDGMCVGFLLLPPYSQPLLTPFPLKGGAAELPRGRYDPICRYLERRLDRDEGLDRLYVENIRRNMNLIILLLVDI